MKGPSGETEAARGRFRELRVAAKTAESSLITSFRLETTDGTVLPGFQPGQFLVLKCAGVDGSGPVLRNYSLSGSSDDPTHYRISVKREGAAAPDLPAGLVSNHLHDKVAVGDILTVEGPRGAFILDETSTRPVVLLSGGVGLTPMVSMLHALAARSDRRVLFLHACENGAVHALRDEVSELVGRRPGLAAHFCYRTPSGEDRAAGRFDSEGVIDRALLQRLLCLDDYDFYLCGPPPFMQAVYRTLRGLGVAKDRIAYEFFGPATVLEAEEPTKPAPAKPAAAAVAAEGAITVEFRKSGITAEWDGNSKSLLDFAEDEGLTPEFSCRAGICNTCQSRILSGDVTYFEDPLEDMPDGEILICCSRPKTSVVLDL